MQQTLITTTTAVSSYPSEHTSTTAINTAARSSAMGAAAAPLDIKMNSRQYSIFSKLFIAGLVLSAIVHAIFFSAGYFLIYATRHYEYDTSPVSCCAAPLPYKNVSFMSPHGNLPNAFVNITGWFFPFSEGPEILIPHCDGHKHLCNTFNTSNNNATIVVVHGHGVNMAKILGKNKSVLHKAVLPFHMAGYNVLAIDLRNHGLSGDALPVSLGKFEYLDVLSAVDFIRDLSASPKPGFPSLDANRIAIWGESMGGSTVLFAAGNDKESHVKAVVCDSSFASAKETFRLWANSHSDFYIPYAILDYLWGCIVSVFPYTLVDVRPVDMVSSIKVPLFVTHGRTDTVVPFAQADQLISAARARDPAVCGPKGCVIESMFHEGDHVFAWDTPEVVIRMVDFMEAHV